jgi:hypothetical protein
MTTVSCTLSTDLVVVLLVVLSVQRSAGSCRECQTRSPAGSGGLQGSQRGTKLANQNLCRSFRSAAKPCQSIRWIEAVWIHELKCSWRRPLKLHLQAEVPAAVLL